MPTITHILFDLGRVLIKLDGPPPLDDKWLPQPWSEEEKWRRWTACPAVVAYESGKLSADEFANAMIAYFHLTTDVTSFKQRFVAWPQGFLPGAEALLRQLQPRYTLAFYSNTSDLHFPLFMKDLGLAQYFDFSFASYQIGYYKPDIAGFLHVQQSMAVPSRRILFIDDLPANVSSARQAGMRAEQAMGVEQVKRVLREYGCIE